LRTEGAEIRRHIELVHTHELRSRRAEARHDPGDRRGGGIGPGVEQDDRAVAVRQRTLDHGLFHSAAGAIAMPVEASDVPADVPVSELTQLLDELCAVSAAPEWHAEPGARVHTDELPDRALRGANVGPKAAAAEERHARVIEAVAADQVAVSRQGCGEIGVGLRPSSLHEERGSGVELSQRPDQGCRATSSVGPIRMLGIEGEGNPESRDYFSTPLITMPRVKKRWNAMKRITGITSVIRVPAWISSGLR